MNADRNGNAAIVGVGAAACVACCAGPIVAFLGGLSLAGLVSTFLIGSIGIMIAVLAVAGAVVVHHRRRCATPDTSEIPVALSRRSP